MFDLFLLIKVIGEALASLDRYRIFSQDNPDFVEYENQLIFHAVYTLILLNHEPEVNVNFDVLLNKII